MRIPGVSINVTEEHLRLKMAIINASQLLFHRGEEQQSISIDTVKDLFYYLHIKLVHIMSHEIEMVCLKYFISFV